MDPEQMFCSQCGKGRHWSVNATWPGACECGSQCFQSEPPSLQRALRDVAAGNVTFYPDDQSFLASLS